MLGAPSAICLAWIWRWRGTRALTAELGLATAVAAFASVGPARLAGAVVVVTDVALLSF